MNFTTKTAMLATALSALTTFSARAQVPAGWAATNYQATDIAVGKNGAVWTINQEVSYQVNAGMRPWPWPASRMAVGPDGTPWIIDTLHRVMFFNGSGFVPTKSGVWDGKTWAPYTGNDIGIGANGWIWIIGTDSYPYWWDGRAFNKFVGLGVKISVGPDGKPWVVTGAGTIFQWTGSLPAVGYPIQGAWKQYPGWASDISVGPDGTVYVVGGSNVIYRWNGTGWVNEGVAGPAIAAGAGLHAWLARAGATVITR